MLYKCSNKEKVITQTQITHIINSIGIARDRRTIGRNLQYLIDAGVPVVRIKGKGYYYDHDNDNFFNLDNKNGGK